MIGSAVDRLAVWLATWGLRRLYGADCDTDVRDDFPDEPNLTCISCDAKRLIAAMRDINPAPAAPDAG